MSSRLHSSIVGSQVDVSALGPRMEAATEALLRVRDEVVSTIDRQVSELQMIHRAFAVAPVSTLVLEEGSSIESSPKLPGEGPSLFENPPQMPDEPAAMPVPPRMKQQTVKPAASPAQYSESLLAEGTLDPLLEQATLEELNDALANAFAMVSSRAHR